MNSLTSHKKIRGVLRSTSYRVLRRFFAESEYRVFNPLTGEFIWNYKLVFGRVFSSCPVKRLTNEKNWKKCKHSICFVFSYLGSCLYNVNEVLQMDLNE